MDSYLAQKSREEVLLKIIARFNLLRSFWINIMLQLPCPGNIIGTCHTFITTVIFYAERAATMVFVYHAVITKFIGCPVQVFQLGRFYPFYNIYFHLVMELCAIVTSPSTRNIKLLQHSTPSQPVIIHYSKLFLFFSCPPFVDHE